MKSKRHTFLLLTIVALLLCNVLCGCNDEKNPPLEESADSQSESLQETDEPTSPELVIAEKGTSIFHLVRPENASTEIVDASKKVYEALAAVGINVEFGVDWEDYDADPKDRYRYEILIGHTNREESDALGKELLNEDYVIATQNDKLVICGGGDEATAIACSRFIADYVMNCKGSIVLQRGELLRYTTTYDITAFKLDGVDVKDYSIVYTVFTYKEAATRLRDEIAKYTGRVFPVVTMSKAGDKRIIVGAPENASAVAPCTAEKFFALPDNSTNHVIEQKDGTLLLAGKNEYAVLDAVETFSATYLQSTKGELNIPDVSTEHTLFVATPLADGADVRIMTFNTLGTNGDNPSVRFPLIFETVRRYLPDVVGFQEANKTIHSAVLEDLTDVYDFVNKYHDAGAPVNYTPIMYRKDKFNCIAGGVEFLRSRYTGTNTKSYSWAVLELKSTGKRFIVLNLHGALISPAYNLEGMTNAVEGAAWRRDNVAQLHERAVKLQTKYGALPTFLIGDFNFNKAAAAYSDATALGYVTAEKTATQHKETGTKTTHGIGSAPPSGKSIDHIFYQGNTTVFTHYIVRDETALAASDHCPVYCDAKLN